VEIPPKPANHELETSPEDAKI